MAVNPAWQGRISCRSTASVSGGVGGAERGTLTVMMPARAPIGYARPALGVIGKVFFIGEKPGSAQTMKLANNPLRHRDGGDSEAVVMGVKS
jgi:hypothetical protein